MTMLQFIKQQVRNVRGLNTVPGVIALALWAFSLVSLWIDLTFPEFSTSQPFRLFYTDYDTAKSVLSTVASASITTLGLVYSIVLVVFTTAAGNIGPRLLQRFTSDRVNQFTAGLFGGTFLFSLTVLHQTDAEFVPAFSIAMTFFLAGLSVLQLIYFVHEASSSVTIDREVAAIATTLERDVGRLVDDEEGRDEYEQDPPHREEMADSLYATASGYVTYIDVKALVALAEENDLFITLKIGHGEFVLSGILIAEINKSLEGNARDELFEAIHNCLDVSEFRSPDSDVEFSINLLIEIALRALSPGVNDTFTAIACIDRISSALVKPVRHGLRDHIRADNNSVPRLYLPDLALDDLVNTAFHPLRRAAVGNVLMTKHIMEALGRLNQIADEEAHEVLKTHAGLLIESAKGADLLIEDLDFLNRRFDALFGA